MKGKLGFLKDENNPTPKKHRLLDLRNMEHFSNFNMYKCVYKVHSQPVNITLHTDSTKKEEEKADQILFKLLTEGMEDLHQRDIPPYAIIHIYLKCEGMETDFMFSGTGPNRLTLAQIRGNKLQQIIDQFSNIIQSGKTVSIDDHTILTLYAFISPVEYR